MKGRIIIPREIQDPFLVFPQSSLIYERGRWAHPQLGTGFDARAISETNETFGGFIAKGFFWEIRVITGGQEGERSRRKDVSRRKRKAGVEEVEVDCYKASRLMKDPKDV